MFQKKATGIPAAFAREQCVTLLEWRGNEARIRRSSAPESDQKVLIVGAIDYCRPDAVGIID